jgi:hypothetical protein
MELNRRNVIKLAAGGLGLNLNPLLWSRRALGDEQAGLTAARIKSCIVIFYYGGPSHLDMFDTKPDAPSNIRGEFKPISTSVPGLQVSELLPAHAKIMHKVAIIRSMHHTNRLHDSASTESLTGRQSPQGDREEFAPIEQFYPCHGASVSYMRRDMNIEVPHAALPWVFHNVVDTPCQGGGFLGSTYDPFQINGDAAKVSFQADLFTRRENLSLNRLLERRTLAKKLTADNLLNSYQQPQELDKLYTRAMNLIQSKRLAKALRIEEESLAVREKYGLYPEAPAAGVRNVAGYQMRGQNLLLARRLVEAEVPYVNVYDFRQQGQNWDSHSQNFKEHKNRLVPPMDKAYAALINDLDERGLLDSTLVVALGEFGRTPKINGNAGRDHWPDCYSLTLAGGGIQGGAVWGESDKIGAYPVQDAVTPADLAATIYWRFGIDPQTIIQDQLGRPHRLAEGEPIRQLFI